MARSAVAAEDANFCQHWGFDVAAIKLAIAEGSERGASTISQQVVKNVYLWHSRTWFRKAMEASITPLMEAIWSKRRIIEVYLNVAEFDEGVFGVDAAARHYFGVSARDKLSPTYRRRGWPPYLPVAQNPLGVATLQRHPRASTCSIHPWTERPRSAADGRAAVFRELKTLRRTTGIEVGTESLLSSGTL